MIKLKHKGHDRFWQEVEEGKWEPETFKVLEKYCKPGKTFIDIGAWNGVCSIYAALLGADVHAAEPDVTAQMYASGNIELNGVGIKLHPVGISGESGQAFLGTNDEFGNSMSSIVRKGDTRAVSIDTLTLEDFMGAAGIDITKVSLIKMDIEGGEVEALPQASRYLRKHKPTLYVSLHPFWFRRPQEDTLAIAHALFSAYPVVADTSGKTYEDWTEFVRAVEGGVHSFVCGREE